MVRDRGKGEGSAALLLVALVRDRVIREGAGEALVVRSEEAVETLHRIRVFFSLIRAAREGALMYS